MTDNSKISKILSAPDVKHGISLFNNKEVNAVDKLITLLDGKYFIKCQIKNKYKVAKPEEIVRQLWIYRLFNEYNYPKERIDVKKIVYFDLGVEPRAADIVWFSMKIYDITIFYLKLKNLIELLG